MSNDEIKELIQLVVDSGIAELKLQRGDSRVRIRRTLDRHEMTMTAPMPASMPTSIAETVHTSSSPAAPPPPPANEHIVKSPIVGTYYESPKPGDPPFVKV